MTSTPTIIGDHPLNGRDVLRVEISEYNGRPVVSARKWYDAGAGVLKPSPKGITVALGHLPMLAALMNKALDHAKAGGLLNSDGGHQ